jgi:fumarate reductase subunit D
MTSRLPPLLWLAFSAGGTVAAFLLPIHLALFGLVFPMGWATPPDHGALARLAGHPLARVYLFVAISLPLFHWAHRFRYTLYDGLQLKHLAVLIAVLCYGAAVCGTALSAYTLLTFPAY